MVGEILFRGKRVDGKGWAYGSLIQMDEYASQSFIFPRYEGASTLPCGHLVSSNMVVVIPETVGQFIWRTDDNGIKIFEGDTVDCCGGEYYMGSWEYADTIKNVDILTHGFILGEWEHVWVTGNIHDTRKAPTDAPTSGEQG